jgi:hypothetical protein
MPDTSLIKFRLYVVSIIHFLTKFHSVVKMQYNRSIYLVKHSLHNGVVVL